MSVVVVIGRMTGRVTLPTTAFETTIGRLETKRIMTVLVVIGRVTGRVALPTSAFETSFGRLETKMIMTVLVVMRRVTGRVALPTTAFETTIGRLETKRERITSAVVVIGRMTGLVMAIVPTEDPTGTTPLQVATVTGRAIARVTGAVTEMTVVTVTGGAGSLLIVVADTMLAHVTAIVAAAGGAGTVAKMKGVMQVTVGMPAAVMAGMLMIIQKKQMKTNPRSPPPFKISKSSVDGIRWMIDHGRSS